MPPPTEGVSALPRIAPAADAAALPPSTVALLARLGARTGLGETPAIFGVLANHPRLFERLMGAGLGSMPEALLPLPQREVVILRTARNCEAEYEWIHHVRHAPERNVTLDQLRLARDGADPGASGIDAVIVAAVDELHDTATLSDHAWSRLSEYLEAGEILELLVLVGYYRIFAYLENACQVTLEQTVVIEGPGPWPLIAGARP